MVNMRPNSREGQANTPYLEHEMFKFNLQKYALACYCCSPPRTGSLIALSEVKSISERDWNIYIREVRTACMTTLLQRTSCRLCRSCFCVGQMDLAERVVSLARGRYDDATALVVVFE